MLQHGNFHSFCRRAQEHAHSNIWIVFFFNETTNQSTENGGEKKEISCKKFPCQSEFSHMHTHENGHKPKLKKNTRTNIKAWQKEALTF